MVNTNFCIVTKAKLQTIFKLTKNGQTCAQRSIMLEFRKSKD